MRCGKCGNENADENRFCGMCGAPVPGKPAAWPTAPQRTPTENIAGGSRSAPVSSPPYAKEPYTKESGRIPQAGFDRSVPQQPPSTRHEDRPVITGPSFLGLNQPSSRAGLGELHESHGGQHNSSDRLAYLLEDEEPPSRNWLKIALLLVALVLVAGLAYMHWMQGGFESLLGKPKPSEGQPAADTSQSSTDSGSAKSNPPPSADTAPVPQPATTGNDATGTGTTGMSTTAPPGTGTAAAGNGPGGVKENPPPTAGAQSLPDTSGGTPAAGAAATPKQAQQPPSDTSAMAKSAPPTQPLDSEEAPPPAKPTAGSRTDSRRTAPTAAAKPGPFNPVTEAERYLYGRGVRQDCDRGLRLLKPAAATANPAAMISMGALYSTGTCTPRDLPTAYRWFAMALHKEPNNQALQDDLQKLWSRMTPPERQLAIKLSK